MYILHQCWSTRMPGELCVKVAIHLVGIHTPTKAAPPCMAQGSWQAEPAIMREPPGLKAKVHGNLFPAHVHSSILHSANDAQQQSPDVNLRPGPTYTSSSLLARNAPQTLHVHWLPHISDMFQLCVLCSNRHFLYSAEKSVVRRPGLLARSTLQLWFSHLPLSLRNLSLFHARGMLRTPSSLICDP